MPEDRPAPSLARSGRISSLESAAVPSRGVLPALQPLCRDALGSVGLRERAVKRTHRRMPCFACYLEHQTIGKSQRSPDAKVGQSRGDELNAGNPHVRVIEGWGQQRPHLLGGDKTIYSYAFSQAHTRGGIGNADEKHYQDYWQHRTAFYL